MRYGSVLGKVSDLQTAAYSTNLFHATDLFVYPLKTSKNFWFSKKFI